MTIYYPSEDFKYIVINENGVISKEEIQKSDLKHYNQLESGILKQITDPCK